MDYIDWKFPYSPCPTCRIYVHDDESRDSYFKLTRHAEQWLQKYHYYLEHVDALPDWAQDKMDILVLSLEYDGRCAGCVDDAFGVAYPVLTALDAYYSRQTKAHYDVAELANAIMRKDIKAVGQLLHPGMTTRGTKQ